MHGLFEYQNSVQMSNYEKELEEMKHMTRQEYIAHLRRYCLMHADYTIASHVWKIAQHESTLLLHSN